MKICAIYTRKSKVDDNSQSMETQVQMCTDYLESRFGKGNFTTIIYDKDYGITGHSIKKRKDFQRMMQAVKEGSINMVCIQRFDRIARNTRDFCNLYHDMEQAGCELVSVSQQIDTSTPYGKKFMYDLASTAELEWALSSERRKDVNKYAMLKGTCNLSPYAIPVGFKAVRINGIRKMVHDEETEPIIYDLIEQLRQKNSINGTLIYINRKYDKEYSHALIDTFRRSSFYYGSYRENDNYCEPYIDKEEWLKLTAKKPIRPRYHDADSRNMFFTGLLRCPVCGTRLEGQIAKNKGYDTYYYTYRCHKNNSAKLCTFNRYIGEKKIEKYLIETIFEKLDYPDIDIKPKNAVKKVDKSKYKEELRRLNVMYQKGRIDDSEYDSEYERITELLNHVDDEPKQVDYEKIKANFPKGWLEIYKKLNRANKKKFWLSVIKEIKFNEHLIFTDIIFVDF